MKVKFEISLQAAVKKEGKWYIASCEVLDVHSQGKTESKALSNLVEALTLFIESCWDRGTLDEVLKNSGFEPSPIERHEQGRSGEHTIKIPLPLASRDHATAHAN